MMQSNVSGHLTSAVGTAVQVPADSSATRRRFGYLALLASAIWLVSDIAAASQGPGTGTGTAGPLTRLAMAIIVYGASALVVGAGLIRALRK
ncbi:hypothetical protein EI065_24210 [Escherichia coli]|uniref:hypothetical protein n=1 Tax=Pseudomonadota TaxID=1224 RepID=UPI00128EFAB6|nr:hypothetical protein [Escherichia coli]MQH18433.1 hypothetical protein [Escherichia coli]